MYLESLYCLNFIIKVFVRGLKCSKFRTSCRFHERKKRAVPGHSTVRRLLITGRKDLPTTNSLIYEHDRARLPRRTSSRTDSRAVSRFYKTPKVQYHVRKSPPQVSWPVQSPVPQGLQVVSSCGIPGQSLAFSSPMCATRLFLCILN